MVRIALSIQVMAVVSFLMGGGGGVRRALALQGTVLPPTRNTHALAIRNRIQQLDPVPLHSISIGEETSHPPVIFLHGLLGSSRNFQTFMRNLHESLRMKRALYAIDLRNHGQSPHHDEMNYPAMASDVITFIKNQGFDHCVLIGHSMGGKVAATVGFAESDLVHSMAILDISPVPYSGTDGSNWKETQRIIRAIHDLDLDVVQDRKHAENLLMKDIPDPAIRAFAVTNLQENSSNESGDDRKFSWKVNTKTIVEKIDDVAGFDLGQGRTNPVDSLDVKFAKDTLVVAGGNSRYIRSSHLPVFERFFPSYTLATIRNCGHWVHAEAPQETIKLLTSFLDR